MMKCGGMFSWVKNNYSAWVILETAEGADYEVQGWVAKRC